MNPPQTACNAHYVNFPQHGWWFPEREEPGHGIWESNANLLTDQSAPYDPAMGTYQLRGLLCRVEKE